MNPPSSPPRWSELLVKRAPSGMSWIVGLAAGAGLSLALQSLSSGVLWFPQEWRYGITFLIGLAVSITSKTSEKAVSQLTKWAVAPKGAERRNKTPDRRAAARKRIRQLCVWRSILTVAALAASFFLLWRTNTLRSSFIWKINQPNAWWVEQFGATATSEVTQVHLYDFIDFKNRTVFLPNKFDGIERSYLLKLGEINLAGAATESETLLEGVRVALDKEPIRLIDWAAGRGRPLLHEATRRMFATHVALMLSIALVWGFLPKRERPSSVKNLLKSIDRS